VQALGCADDIEDDLGGTSQIEGVVEDPRLASVDEVVFETGSAGADR